MPTVFRPFFTVFDRFPDDLDSQVVRRLKGRTVFQPIDAVKKR